MPRFNRRRINVDFTAAGAGATEILAAVAGKRYGILAAAITVDTVGMDPRFEDTGGDDRTGPLYLTADAGFVLPMLADEEPWFLSAMGENIQINVAAAGKVGGIVIVDERSY